MAESMHMEMGESENTQWYEILLAQGEDMSGTIRIDYVFIIICIKIIFSKIHKNHWFFNIRRRTVTARYWKVSPS